MHAAPQLLPNTGYDTYILVLYIMVVAVFVAVLGLVWLTLAMRKQEQSKWLKTAAMILHIAYDLIFMMFYVSHLMLRLSSGQFGLGADTRS